MHDFNNNFMVFNQKVSVLFKKEFVSPKISADFNCNFTNFSLRISMNFIELNQLDLNEIH